MLVNAPPGFSNKALIASAPTASKASSVGANTVNGPSLAKVSVNSAALIASF